jgi:CheY-like chemotaxis protein
MSQAASVAGLLLCDDLLFSSRITGTARALGLAMQVVRAPALLLEQARRQRPSCVILDLGQAGLDVAGLLGELAQVCGRLPRIVAYGSHVDTETLRSARAAGCDLVLPRSKLVEQLEQQLPHWLAEQPTPRSEGDSDDS